jgi:uncharacterized protein YkwD
MSFRFLWPSLALLAACAAPASAGSCGIPAMREAIQQRINQVRASARVCGSQRMRAADPLSWNTGLFSAAAGHSADMARRGYFAHRSPEGTLVAQRVAKEGYAWRAVGENLAAGDSTVPAVMASWLASDSHCRNLMDPAYAEVAVACVQQPGSTYGTYWTMVLAVRQKG